MRYLLPLFGLLLIIGCISENKKFNPTQEKEKLEQIMSSQEKSWNEYDLESFMTPYWKSDSLSFIGKSGINKGWNTTLKSYQKSYPNPIEMGQLQFTNLHIDIINNQNAYIIGKWELFRSQDTLSGHYTLLWKKLDGNWKIVSDHSS